MIKLILVILISIQAYSQIIETPSLENCFNSADQATINLDPHDVIYVFDIDNTVLGLNQNLGSVQWFRWQQSLIKDNIEKDRVAKTVDELLTIQGLIYHLSQTQTPETTTANMITAIQGKGHPVLYHTSRGSDVRDITERDLSSNGLLPINSIGPINGFAGKFTFVNGTENQKPVTFQNGIYMSAGQDKGVWLKLLFEKTSTTLKHLVFVDDEIKNLQNVERAFNTLTPMTLCRYGKLDDVVSDFNKSDKSVEAKFWLELSGVASKFK